jgi:biotin synthase-related radical SAM superfamily protein
MTTGPLLLNIIGVVLVVTGLVMYIFEKLSTLKKVEPTEPSRTAEDQAKLIEAVSKLIEAFGKLNVNIQLIFLGIAAIVLGNSELMAALK